MGGVCLFVCLFSPHGSADSLEAICKGILSDHVKVRLVSCMCFMYAFLYRLYEVLGA